MDNITDNASTNKYIVTKNNAHKTTQISHFVSNTKYNSKSKTRNFLFNLQKITTLNLKLSY